MPEINPIFINAYELTGPDLQANADAITASEDHIVADAIVLGRRFVGFEVTNPSLTSVKVTAGRFYNVDGGRYFRDETAAAISLDLSDKRPRLQSRVIAIIAYQDEQPGPLLYRYHETDAETGTKVSEQVVYSRLRKAKIEAVGGPESASPQPPTGLENAVILATLTMTPAGIVENSIVRNEALVLPNLCEVAEDVEDLDGRMDVIEPIVRTLSSDLAKLQAQASAAADRSLLYAAVDQLALVQKKLDIPGTYTGFRADDFLDNSGFDKAAIGLAARADFGLRLPLAAADVKQLALFNQFEPNAKVSGLGLVLPKYTQVDRRIVKGNSGSMSLAQYANESHSLLKVALGRTRVRFGGDFEASVSSGFFVGGSLVPQGALARYTFAKAGETFQVEDTGKLDASGGKIYRVSQYWQETSPTYWGLNAASEPIIGYARTETWLNTQDGWCDGIGPDLLSKPATGLITVGICGTYRGEPDFENVIAMATLSADKVNIGSATPDFQGWFGTEPFFLEGGKRYGMFIVTPAAYEIAIAQADAGAGGTCFYATNGGVQNPDPAVHMMFRLRMLKFPVTNVAIEFEALQLAGGIQMIDVLTDGIIPGQCDLGFEVMPQGSGTWGKLDEADTSVLDNPPPLARFRAVFVGTTDAMPALRLSGSQVTVSRLAPTGKLIMPLRTFGSAVSTVTLLGRIKPGFDPAHHFYTPSLRKADGTVKVADAVTRTVDPDGTTIVRATFSFAGSPVTQFRPVVDYGTDAIQRPIVGGPLTEIAV